MSDICSEARSIRKISIDFETYSEADIRKTGSYRYIMDPSFEILLCAYAVDDQPVEVIDLTTAHGNRFFNTDFKKMLFDENTQIHAYNAAFELMCIARHFDIPVTAPYVHRFRCTMAHGLYSGYAAGLAVLGDIIGLPQDKKKMSIGTRLIGIFCKPQKPTKTRPDRTRIYPSDEPEKWSLFKEYCRQDVETEREIKRRLNVNPMPDSEQALWELDILSNYKGVGIDLELVGAALELNSDNTDELTEEAKEITELENPNSVSQLLAWMKQVGVPSDKLRKADVTDLLGDKDIPPSVRRVLEIRQQLGKTSCKKYDAMQSAVCADGRIRGVTQYYGANRTGRYAGRLIQLQNLPQNHIDDLAYARELVKARDADTLRLMYGESIPDTLSQLIRTALIPENGKSYVIADYSAIEARVIAWLAGEQWVLDTFRNGGDIYCDTASQMFGVPVVKHGVNGELRQKGKVAQLACGYGGGPGAMINMGALRMGLKEEDLPDLVMRWRKANPKIVSLWGKMDEALMGVLDGEPQYPFSGISLGLTGDAPTHQRFMALTLPSGRKLFYADPHLAPARNMPNRLSFHYFGMNQVTKKWEAVDTWGGKAVENIVQAIARDLLCNTLKELYRAGFTPVFHVHDEVIIEAPVADRDEALRLMLEIMATPPDWADGLPLKGAGFTAEFYQKD